MRVAEMEQRHRLIRALGQAFLYLLFAVTIGYFSASPAYQSIDPERAMIKVSFSHAGAQIRDCRRLSPEEIAELPPNMRRATDCPRERVPIVLELELDERVLYRGIQPPAGIWRDGPSTVYQRFVVDAGGYILTARLRDSRRQDGFDYSTTADITLAPGQIFVITFRAETGGFVFE